MERSEIEHHFPTFFRRRQLVAIRLPRLTKRTWMVAAVILAMVLVDGIFSLRRREYMGRVRRYPVLSPISRRSD
jgi:hypothetical protein